MPAPATSVDIALLLNVLTEAPLATLSVIVTAVLRKSPVPAHPFSLLPLEIVYRMFQCVSASCD